MPVYYWSSKTGIINVTSVYFDAMILKEMLDPLSNPKQTNLIYDFIQEHDKARVRIITGTSTLLETAEIVEREAIERLAKSRKIIVQPGPYRGKELVKKINNPAAIQGIRNSITLSVDKLGQFIEFVDTGVSASDTSAFMTFRETLPGTVETSDAEALYTMKSLGCTHIVTLDTGIHTVTNITSVKIVSDNNPKAGQTLSK